MLTADSIPCCVLPVGQVIHFFGSPVNVRFEMDEFPHEVRIDVSETAGSNLNFGDWDKHLIPDDFHFRMIGLTGPTLYKIY